MSHLREVQEIVLGTTREEEALTFRNCTAITRKITSIRPTLAET
jgi:hypothetical protein